MELIKGTYSKEDALEIVEQIIRIKTKFHEEKINLSDSEEDIKMREKRIKSLQNDLSNFRMAIYSQSGLVNMNALLKLHNLDNGTHNFSLINGTFDFEDAHEILMTAYRAKINFHTIKAYGMIVRGETENLHHTERINELKAELNKIKELLATKKSQGKKITINSVLSLGFESEEEVNVQG